MAKYRQLYTAFWQDAFVMELSPEEKYFYLYLLTNAKTTQCGIYELPLRVMEMETGYSKEALKNLLERFESYGRIVYSQETKELCIVNWLKYNMINSRPVISCICSELKQVKDKTLIRYLYGIDTLPIPIGEEEEENKKKKDKKKENKPPLIPPGKGEKKEEYPDKEEIKIFLLKEGHDEAAAEHESQDFFDHYESNGWKVGGKTKMKNWQAAARKWMRSPYRQTKPKQSPLFGASYEERKKDAEELTAKIINAKWN